MKATETKRHLPSLLADLQEEEVLVEVRRRLKEGEDPLNLVEEFQLGMRLVGERYEKGIYYISALIMAGEIMHELGDVILPLLKNSLSGEETGSILLGTVEGDIHYIGKDIVKVMLRCFGFTVHDLGVDVPAAEFQKKAQELKPDIVGLSCLLTSSFDTMGATIELLRRGFSENGFRPEIIIGGIVDEHVCRHVGADGWANDAMKGVRLCQSLIRGRRSSR
ncbi:MAG TPA: cobalamin-dependent protein [Syntrophorhabdaceae bacterium]|jgi:methanogenic corrinoid protein MtbC1